MSEEALLKINGITPQILATLKGHNIRTVEVLAMHKKEALVDMGITEAVAEKILEGVWKRLGYTWKPADKLLEERELVEKLTTGSPRLDELIDGGIETRALNEIAGEFGAGKTQLLFTILAENLGRRTDCSAIFLDTEETFIPKRVNEIASLRGYDGTDILKRTIYAPVLNSEHFKFLVEKADQLIKTRNIKMMLIDSLIAPLRSEFVGRETLWLRQQILNQILRQLLNYAKLFNLAVIFTNQVVQSPIPQYDWDPTRTQMPTGGTWREEVLENIETREDYLKARIAFNYRRVVKRDEMRALVIELADILLSKGVSKGELAKKLAEITPYAEKTIINLLPSKYKVVEKREAGRISARVRAERVEEAEAEIPEERILTSFTAEIECPLCHEQIRLEVNPRERTIEIKI